MAHLHTGTRRQSPGRLFSSVLAPSILLAALVVLVLGPGSAAAQSTAQVTIASVTCDGSPEAVQLTNNGTSTVDLTGWTLVSDPSTETFDLTAVGTLTAGSSVFVNSGPGATGAFVWSTGEVFRNGDATDYARLVDNEGVTVATVNCTAATPATNAMPNGGGPPGDASGLTIGLIAAAAGGALVALTMLVGLIWMGVGVVTGRGRGVRSAQEGEIGLESDKPPVGPPAVIDVEPEASVEPELATHVPPAPEARASEPNLWPYLFVVLGALAAALVLVLALSAGSRRK